MQAIFSMTSKIIDTITRYIGYGCMGAIFLVMIVSSLNAISRYAFGLTSNGFLELQWYLFGAAFMLGGADALRRSEHVRVDALYNKFSEHSKLWIDILCFSLVVIPICALISYLAVPMFLDSFVSGEISNDYGGLVRYPAKFFIPAGFGLIALQALSEVIKSSLKLRTLQKQ